jgi:hypothetical protein
MFPRGGGSGVWPGGEGSRRIEVNLRRAFVFGTALLVAAGAAMADDTLWTRLLSPGNTALAYSARCQGNDVLVAGTVIDTGSGTTDISVVRYTGTGSTLWSRVFDFTPDEKDAVFAPGPDSILYMAEKVNRSPTSVMLVRLNAAGDTVWTRTRPNTGTTRIVADPAGDCWLFGALGSPQPRETLWLGCYDASGNNLLNQSWKLAARHTALGMCRIGSGSLAGAAMLDSSVCLLKFSSSGDTLWTRQLPPSLADTAYAVAASGADEFVVLASLSHVFRVLKIDSDGEMLWTRILPAERFAPGLSVDGAGNVYVAANDGAQGYRVDKYGPGGEFVGTGRGGTGFGLQPVAVAAGSDGLPVVAGIAVDSFGTVQGILTMKFSGTPGGVAGPDEAASLDGLRLFGSVSSGRARLAVPRAGTFRLALFSADGRKLEQRAEWLEAGVHGLDIPVESGAGVQYLMVQGPAGTSRFKLVRAEQ